MPILDVQRRSQQIGRIRIGQQVRTASGGMRPERLSTFRFTTASKPVADAIAALFGGEVRDWQQQYEVITERSEIGVTVPPRDAVISQWYEMWTKGGCQRRCDSQRERISGGPCLCPHAADPEDAEEVAAKAQERARLHKADPSKACGLVTRINVMIPDLPGLGVFRLDTGSFYAAGESGDKADIMEIARAAKVFLPGTLRIEQRKRIAGGKTTPYPVPVLELDNTFREIASGELKAAGIMAQLPPAPGEQRKALTAAPSPDMPRPGTGVPEAAAAESLTPVSADRAVPAGPGQPLDDDERYQLAQAIADECAAPDVTAARFRECVAQAKATGAIEEHVCTDRPADKWQQLSERLEDLWAEKARTA